MTCSIFLKNKHTLSDTNYPKQRNLQKSMSTMEQNRHKTPCRKKILWR